MSKRILILGGVIGAFGALTYAALADVGYLGILEPHFRSWGAGQVFADLVIALLLANIWIVADGRNRGINPWPFVLLTLVAGSFGPLAYLVVRETKAAGTPVASK
ncbi:MAG TPA: hypothetical protein VFG38_08670 [Pseudomonadales bacterium]|nr:hypothetical protein [Pseudomonadales bacterium]